MKDNECSKCKTMPSYQVHYTMVDGSGASACVAAKNIRDVLSHYPTWDTIQKDTNVVIIE